MAKARLGFTKKFNAVQAIFILVLGVFLCWDHVGVFFFGIFFWCTAVQLFKSKKPTNLQVLIWGHKKDKK